MLLEGRIDSLTSPEIRQKIDELVLEGQRIIVADLEKIQYVSSAGLRVFMESHMKLKRVGGEIILLNPQPNILELLQMGSLDMVFRIAADRRQVESFLHLESAAASIQTKEIAGIAFQYIQRDAAPGKLFAIGSQAKLATSSYTEDDAIAVSSNRIRYGTGLASLGGSYEECKTFFGEAMIINRHFFFYPAVKRPAVDFMLCPKEDSNVQYQFLHGFGFNGECAYWIAFEAPDQLIELPRLIEAVFQIVENNRIGLVFLAESKGFWGMHLKQVPILENRPANGKPIFDTDNFPQWVNFPIEPGEMNHILAGVGFAVRNPSAESAEIQEILGKDKNFHLHAGVFSREPLNKKPDHFEEELKRVVTGLEVFKVQHVLGQSKFGSGLLGLILLED